ncbi:uncharacterized protein [Procambarus clarkii]|uniref:uncharacterized protein n=1 Tax=Procambarus clarkii TaxID=6728 RepID=UPI003744317B
MEIASATILFCPVFLVERLRDPLHQQSAPGNEGKIDSETHENYYIADKHALAAIKLKLKLANIERQQKEALQIKECEMALRDDEGKIDSETHENYYIADKHVLAAIKLKLELANIERQQQKEALQIKECEMALKKEEAALRKEEREQEAALLREREREQLEARKRDLEMQREYSKQQADRALEYRRQELALETTHHTQRQ